ncbi:hypothetical protein B566_EDAN016522 [Ephemera danica]|nr:hypothetical protein B566_EDAN016522 [Ephemera danica]
MISGPAMTTTLNSSIKRRLQQVSLEDAVLAKNSADILKSLLQILVADKTNLSPKKLQIVIIIEEEWDNFLFNSNDVTLAVSAFHALVKCSNESHNYVLQGQCLMSATSFLLMSLQKVGIEELHKCFASHLEYLLTLISQSNNSQNIYLRSVAATCLAEVELTIQGVLLECFEVIYTLTAFETSIAHQQYLELLCVLMSHSQDNSNPTLDVPVFHVPPSLSKIVSALPGNKFSKSEVEQMAVFALDQLPLLTTTASVRVTVHIASLLKLLNPQASLGSVHLLQPVLQQYLYSFNLTACQLVLRLERDFKTSEHFKDDSYRQSIVEHLSHCSTLSTLPVSSRLIFVTWLKQFLAGHPEKSHMLYEKDLLQPQNKDGSHTRLKKIEILPYLLQNTKGDRDYQRVNVDQAY